MRVAWSRWPAADMDIIRWIQPLKRALACALDGQDKGIGGIRNDF